MAKSKKLTPLQKHRAETAAANAKGHPALKKPPKPRAGGSVFTEIGLGDKASDPGRKVVVDEVSVWDRLEGGLPRGGIGDG